MVRSLVVTIVFAMPRRMRSTMFQFKVIGSLLSENIRILLAKVITAAPAPTCAIPNQENPFRTRWQSISPDSSAQQQQQQQPSYSTQNGRASLELAASARLH